ncbi:MAG: nif-specific transcriptional activator NifA [Rhodocyclales bacterium GWA2_65_20]|nr:MAG: nif-specific transcriptional activator NifA [Rhodocyclales bacterium GWA2_65_20]
MSANPAALHRIELEALYRVGEILSRSLDFRHTLREVLRTLDEQAGMSRGMVTVLDPESGDLVVNAVSGQDDAVAAPVRYQSGEGVLGLILDEKRTVALAAAGAEPRFLNRIGIYDRRLPFIAAPINLGGNLRGVLAVQPNTPDDGLLAERTRFVEMVANLIGHSVRLSLDIEQEKKSLAEERDSLRRTVRHQYGFDNIVGRSAPMRRVFDQVRMVSKWNTTVLLRGETGTGKELIANAIHYHSPRSRGPYVRLNCASLPENLLESELFGHEKGAFTGAVAARQGRFEAANGGTLFLDEIGEISPAFQAKLLRVLQEGEFERVGGGRTLKVDVRVIAATHRDLEAAVDGGNFREDLYYRLNVMPIRLPPLRERPEDVPELARYLAGRIGEMQGRQLALTEAAVRRLTQYNWPGNVRELENCLERAAVMSESGTIEAELIRIDRQREAPAPAAAFVAPPPVTGATPGTPPGATSGPAAADAADANPDERARVIAALEQAGWVQARAARLLGMTPRQIAYRIQTLDIEVKQF